jgi:hypothetical protein
LSAARRASCEFVARRVNEDGAFALSMGLHSLNISR